MLRKVNLVIPKRFFWPFKNVKPSVVEKPKVIYGSSDLTSKINGTFGNEAAERNRIWSVISTFNKSLIDQERKLYECRQINQLDSKDKTFIPFNVQRNILKFPIYDNLLADDIESHWINFSHTYDMKYIESIIIGYKEEGKLREFWIASIKLSMNLNFYRDLKFFLENEMKDENFNKEIFSNDFYDCLIGYYFLHGNNLLAKSFHDIIYPKLQPLDIITIVKCCCLVKTKHIEHFQHILKTLFSISKDFNKSKLNSGIYDSLIPFLYTRVLTISNNQLSLKEALPMDKNTDHCNENGLTVEENKFTIDDNKALLYSILDIHLHLLKSGEIPSNKKLLNNLIRYMLINLDEEEAQLTKSQGDHPTDHKRLIEKLRKTFKYLLLSESNDKIYSPKFENWFDKEFIELLLQFCFKDVSASTNVKRNLNMYVLENRLPRRIYRDNQFNFWTMLYELSFQNQGKLSINTADSLFARYVVQDESTILLDFLLDNWEYSKILEIKLKSVNDLSQIFNNEKFLSVLKNDFCPKLQYLDHSSIITPKVFGYLIRYLARINQIDEIQYLVKQLDDIYEFRQRNEISTNKLDDYMKQFSEFYLSEVLKTQDHEDEAYGKRGLVLTKSYIQLLKNTKHFKDFLYTQNYLMSYFTKLKDFHNIEKSMSSLIELNRLNATSINVISRFLINEIKLDHKNEINYIPIIEKLFNFVSRTKNLNHFTDYNWFNIYSLMVFESSDYRTIENKIFWILNKILYSRFYTPKFPKIAHGNRIINEFTSDSKILIEDNNNEIFNKISDEQNDQENLFLKLLKSTISKSKMNEEKLIYNDLPKNSMYIISSEIQIDQYYNFIHKLFTPTLIKRIISTSAEKHSIQPTLGFELINKLHKVNVITKETLELSKNQIKSAILNVIRKLYISNSSKISERWKLARSKSQFYKEFIAKEKFKAMTENSVIPKMLDVPKFEEVVDEFERIGVEIYGEEW